MIALVFGWLITCALFYTLVNSTGDVHSFSYEAGHMRGVLDAKEDGVKELDEDEIEASAIASYLMARKSLDVDLIEYCAGYVAGYAMYLNGFI
jgi:hypothetical protein